MATKKTVKKVDAPIDQHETFVSLQKTFADSEMSVSEKLKTLYELQAADSEMDKIIQLRGELPAEVEQLENEIADLKARSAQLSAVIEQLNRNIADAKLSIAEHESTVEKYQRQLETITNSREYDSLNKEIENQDLLRQIDEKNITDTRYEIAARKADLEDLKDQHNHLAVVSVYNGNACGGCFNTITPQRLVEIASNKKLIICEHCGRIIINPDFE